MVASLGGDDGRESGLGDEVPVVVANHVTKVVIRNHHMA